MRIHVFRVTYALANHEQVHSIVSINLNTTNVGMFLRLKNNTSNDISNAEYDTIPLEGLIDSRHGIVQ